MEFLILNLNLYEKKPKYFELHTLACICAGGAVKMSFLLPYTIAGITECACKQPTGVQ